MPVHDIEFTTMEGRRFTKRGERAQSTRIDTNSTVTTISPLGPDRADVEFRFTVGYGPEGVIKVEGRMVFEGGAEALAKEWAAKRNMPNNLAGEIHTAIVRACIPEAVLLARDLGLPLPIPLPQVKIEEKKGIPPSSGIEVA